MSKPYTPKTMKYCWIMLTLAVEYALFTALNIYVSDTAGLFLAPAFAIVGGWQMGILTERNDWVNGHYITPNRSAPKENTVDE